MAETLSPNYGWTKPDPGASANTWGATLNATTDKIDTQVYVNQQGMSPIGAVTMFAGATAPTNWLICDGRSLSTAAPYDKLFAVLQYAFGGSGANFSLPNLVQNFPLGAGPNPVGTNGGAFAVTLATANLPAHAHSITDVAHNHGVNQWAHTAYADFYRWSFPRRNDLDRKRTATPFPFDLVNPSARRLDQRRGVLRSCHVGQRTDTAGDLRWQHRIATGYGNLAPSGYTDYQTSSICASRLPALGSLTDQYTPVLASPSTLCRRSSPSILSCATYEYALQTNSDSAGLRLPGDQRRCVRVELERSQFHSLA